MAAWEPRIDNGYANVIYDPQHSADKPWRLWYDAFTSCNDDARDDQMRYLHCGGGLGPKILCTACTRRGLGQSFAGQVSVGFCKNWRFNKTKKPKHRCADKLLVSLGMPYDKL